MTPLLVLTFLLFAAWVWGVWERHRRARFMAAWLHVPLFGAATCLFMAIVLAIFT